MFAALGKDIVFDVLKVPDVLSDKRETRYAETPLVNGKPNLQPTGEALIEFTLSIKFHHEWCDPQEEFLKLDNARLRREVLPLIFGNGRNEGDFVITTIERTPVQMDGFGNFIEVNCSVGLKEFANVSTTSRQLEQDKKNAFALSDNRPLPANAQQVPTNPALSVCQENQKAKYSANKMDELSDKIDTDVAVVTDADPNTQLIKKAQKFVDSLGGYTLKVNQEVTKANNALGSINALIAAHAGITGESPTLPAKITALQSSLTGVSTQLTVLGTLPATISNPTDATTALSAMTTMFTAVKTMKSNQEALDSANVALTKAVATKKVLT